MNGMNEDFDAYFASLDKVEQEKSQKTSREPREQKVLYLTSRKTQGRVTFRPISDVEELPDGTRRFVPLRVISGVYELGFPVPAFNEDGTPRMNDSGEQVTYYNRYRICNPENYITKLTPDQAELLKDTMDAIDAFNAFCRDNDINAYDNYGISANWKSEVSLMWGKVLTFVSSVNNDNVIDSNNKVFLLRAASPRFTTAFNNSQKQKTDVQGSSAWRNLTFSRNPEHNNYVCTITTTFGGGSTVGYNFTIGFDRLDNGYALTQDDIDKCTDLNAEYCNVTAFDSELHEYLKRFFEDALAKAYADLNGGNTEGLKAAPEKATSTPSIQSTTPTTNVAAPQVTPVTPPPTIPKFTIPKSL